MYQFTNVQPEKILSINNFKGADFSTVSSAVDFSRSPDCLNMIPDLNGMLSKRTGWKIVQSFAVADEWGNSAPAPIYGIYKSPFSEDILYIHEGTVLLAYNTTDSTISVVISGMAEHKSSSFVFNNIFYILDGTKLRCLRLADDVVTADNVEDIAFIPTTVINRPPSSMGGTPFEAVNLIGRCQKNSFIGNGTSKDFYLTTKMVTNVRVWVDGIELNSSEFTVEHILASKVQINTAPPDGKGVDNVVIQFEETWLQNLKRLDRVNKCTIFGVFGGENDTRVFISGNSDEKNTDFASGLFDGTYFPDNCYTKIGSDQSSIMGYAKIYDSQIIFKDGKCGDSAQYLRTFALDSSNKAFYPVAQGINGDGAVSNSFTVFNDMPLYLSKLGVIGVSSTNVDSQLGTSNLSKRINKRIVEENLSQAHTIVYNGQFYLFLNSYCYVLDNGEWYVLDNIPASCVAEIDDVMYFGTVDGHVCRFKNKDEDGAYNDNGSPVNAFWTTPLSPLGSWNMLKTIKNVYVNVLNYIRSGYDLYYYSEQTLKENVLTQNEDIFTFDDIDFTRFTFRTIQAPQVAASNTKLKNIMLFGVVVANNRDEPFTLIDIDYKYTYSKKYK